MLKITKFQYIERWDALPPVLREAMFSPANGELIWRIGEEHHIQDEQIEKIAGICGNIVMGFIHPEDLAKEIKTDLDIDERLAQAVAREISRKVFSPIRSEMDKVYSPPAPVVSDIIETPAVSGVEPPVVEEKPIGEIAPMPSVPPVVSGVEPEPTEEKKISLEEFQVMGPAGEIIEPSAPQEPPATEQPKPIIEEEQGAPPAVPPAASPAEPFILHEESELKPISETPKSFSLSRFFDFLKKKETKPAEEAPSVILEMGDEKGETVPMPSAPPAVSEVEPETELKEEAPKIKVVDYTEPAPLSEPSQPIESVKVKEEEKPAGDKINLETFEKE